MPRPKKGRRVCCLPPSSEFHPSGRPAQGEAVVLTVDEYEAVRLIDYQGFTQEECAGYMGVGRTTAQEIYSSARKKLSQMLAEARPLRIGGGSYQLCDGEESICRCGGCKKHRSPQTIRNTKETTTS